MQQKNVQKMRENCSLGCEYCMDRGDRNGRPLAAHLEILTVAHEELSQTEFSDEITICKI